MIYYDSDAYRNRLARLLMASVSALVLIVVLVGLSWAVYKLRTTTLTIDMGSLIRTTIFPRSPDGIMLEWLTSLRLPRY